MEPERAFPQFQEPATCTCPEPDHSSPCPIPRHEYSPLTQVWVFQVVFLLQVSPPTPSIHLSFLHTFHNPAYLILLDFIT
jgi:hypothetical protein